jgi:hypothetical protein
MDSITLKAYRPMDWSWSVQLTGMWCKMMSKSRLSCDLCTDQQSRIRWIVSISLNRDRRYLRNAENVSNVAQPEIKWVLRCSCGLPSGMCSTLSIYLFAMKKSGIFHASEWHRRELWSYPYCSLQKHRRAIFSDRRALQGSTWYHSPGCFVTVDYATIIDCRRKFRGVTNSFINVNVWPNFLWRKSKRTFFGARYRRNFNP